MATSATRFPVRVPWNVELDIVGFRMDQSVYSSPLEAVMRQPATSLADRDESLSKRAIKGLEPKIPVIIYCDVWFYTFLAVG